MIFSKKKVISLVLLFTILMATIVPTIVSAGSIERPGKVVNTTTHEITNFAEGEGADPKEHVSTVYAGEVKKDGSTVLTYLYSDNVTRSSVIFDNLRKTLSNPYSDMVPAIIDEQTESGMKELSTNNLNEIDLTGITGDWTDASSIATQIYSGTNTDIVNSNMYDVDNGFKTEIDNSTTERAAAIDYPVETNKRIISHIGTQTTDSVSFRVDDGQLIEVHDVDLYYLSEATTVIYTSVNVVTTPKTVINSINILYDQNKFPFYNNVTTDDFIGWVRNNTSTDNSALEVYSNANTELYTYNDSNLVYLPTSTDKLDVSNEYAILYSITSSTGYEFPNSVTSLTWSDQIPITDIDGFTIKVNGETRNDVYIAYSSSWKCVMVYVPIGKPQEAIPVYRMYNPNSGEHLYTTDAHEVGIIFREQGWGKEGIAWYTSETGTPVYRLYNPKLGNHLYTSDTYEISVITRTQGWVLDFDGAPVMYTKGEIPVYRLFNPGLQGQHHLTTDLNEYRVIPKWGWQQEGIAMRVLSTGVPQTTHYYKK